MMYYAFPPESSFTSFLQKIKSCEQSHVFVMLSFSQAYSTIISKQRYIAERLHLQIPLFVVDVHNSPQIVHHLSQAFPNMFLKNKYPLHICFTKDYNAIQKKLELKPLFLNHALLSETHIKQLQELSQQKRTLASEEKTPTH